MEIHSLNNDSVITSSQKPLLSLLLLILVLLFTHSAAFAQTETFGLVQYTPPAGWNKTQTQPNVVAFSILDQTTGGFCIITASWR